MSTFRGNRSAAKNQRAHQRNMARRAENIRLEKERVDETLKRNGKLSQADQDFLKKHFKDDAIELKAQTKRAKKDEADAPVADAKPVKKGKGKPAKKEKKNGNLAAALATAGVK
jgi:SMC interacting uncharacterized protein involved in chromosome segregation